MDVWFTFLYDPIKHRPKQYAYLFQSKKGTAWFNKIGLVCPSGKLRVIQELLEKGDLASEEVDRVLAQKH